MRIKRFIAPDMRTALSMVRNEQGPDAVILSNRVTADGIEVVAATDYDEALVAQAQRTTTPTLHAVSTPPPSAVGGETTAFAKHLAGASTPRPALAAVPTPTPSPGKTRDGLAARARAVFRIGDGPTLAELTAAAPTAAAGIPSPPRASVGNQCHAEDSAAPLTFADALNAATFEPDQWDGRIADDFDHAPNATLPVQANPQALNAIANRPDTEMVAQSMTSGQRASRLANSPPALRVVTNDAAAATDPSMLAMREELATMRQLIERQMEQLSVERLRGSAVRAAAYDALMAYGCDDSLAQAVAARLDPQLPMSEVQASMLAELAQMLTIAQSEPLDDGGVIALVGPTGAGKTTAAVKLAARFAARHRARDVALVTTDSERAGAHEQLHAHGRRLGITVCQTSGPEGLTAALAQLTDYPLVLVDTTGYAPHDRANFSQILWLRASHKVRSLLVLPANAHPHHLGDVIRRYQPASPEGVVLTKLDETSCLGSALSVAVRHGLTLTYTTHGQQVPADIDLADATRLAGTLEKLHRAADHTLANEDRHVSV